MKLWAGKIVGIYENAGKVRLNWGLDTHEWFKGKNLEQGQKG